MPLKPDTYWGRNVPVDEDTGSLAVFVVNDKNGLKVIAEFLIPLPIAPGSLSAFSGATEVLLEVQGGSVRFRLDDSAATATAGRIAYAGDLIQLDESELSAFSAAVYEESPSLWAVWRG